VIKDFETWNTTKKYLQESGENKFYHPREIWWCSLGVNVGFEEDGTSSEFQRPVLVLRGFSKQVCLVIPLTTSQKTNPFHMPVGLIDGKRAFAIISQLRLVDTKRFTNKVTVIDQKVFEIIRKAVKDLL
jgi:mRNA interferase MazF